MEELNIRPAAETQALYEAIRAGEVQPDTLETRGSEILELIGEGELSAVAESALSTATAMPGRGGHNLPPDATTFIGRADELAMLDKLIVDPGTRLINVTGPGGIGKTRLALAVARKQIDRFRHGVFFVPLASVESAEYIVPAVANALDLPIQDEGRPKKQLLDYLRPKSMLLIFDNFEHLADGNALLFDMMRAAPHLTLLVTSREMLHLRQEQVFAISGLMLSDSELPENVIEADAPKLFVQRARQLLPGFTVYEPDLANLDAICRLVEGMPLAIELAAGWVDKVGLNQIAALVRQSLDFLRTEAWDVPERHSSIRAVIDTSWRQLSAKDRLVFKSLSVFRGGFTLEAGRDIVGLSFTSLSRLASKSLLQFNREQNRYHLHELLRQFAAMQLARDKRQSAAVLEDHATYYCQLLAERESDLKGFAQNAALVEIEAEHGNIQRAWRTAAERGLVRLLDGAVNSLSLYYRYRFLPEEFVTACQIVLQHLTKMAAGGGASSEARRILAKVTAMQAAPYVHATLGSEYLASEESLKSLEWSRDRFEEMAAAGQDVRREQAFAYMRMGALMLNVELDQSAPLLEESLALYRQLGDRWGQSEAVLALSSARLRLQGYQAAKPFWEESLAIKRQEGDRRGLADSLTLLGMRAMSYNQMVDGRRYAQECFNTYLQIGGSDSLAEAHWNYGVLMTWAGQFAEAERNLTKAENIYKELGRRAPALIRGNTLAMLGQYDEVVDYVKNYQATAGVTGDQPNEARAYHWLGYVALIQGEFADAQELFHKSIAVYQACGLNAYAGFIYCFLALAARGLGNHNLSWVYLTQGLRLEQANLQLGPLGYWICSSTIGVLMADIGRLEQAVTAYAFACCHPMIGKSKFFDDVVGKYIRKKESELPPVVAKEARRRGRTGDTWQIGAELFDLVTEMAGSVPGETKHYAAPNSSISSTV
jgi:predicted ATPase